MLRKRELPRRPASGATFVLLAAVLVVLLAIAGLAIDLAALYVARSEAQRAADAAALAGADEFVLSQYASGAIGASQAQGMAAQKAADVGDRNFVVGRNPAIQPSGFTSTCPPDPDSDGCFDFTKANDPRITVVVNMTSARNNAIPTFFMKIFGINKIDVTASATAEAYVPSGNSSTPISTSCLKPWILPNVDPRHTVTATTAPSPCPPAPDTLDPVTGMSNANYYYPTQAGCAGNTFLATIVDPSSDKATLTGDVNNGGAIGETLTLKPGSPTAAAAPSQFYPVTIPPGDAPAACPNCTGPGGGGGSTGASLYAQNIECCNTNTISCFQGVTVDTQTGNMQGPTEQGVECLTHESKSTDTGQDTLCAPDTVLLTDVPPGCSIPFAMYGGSANPDSKLSGQIVTSTPSLVTVPVYDGTPLSPGQSAGTSTVTVVGFVQFFLDSVDGPGANQGNVHATLYAVIPCGSSSSSGSTGGSSGTIYTGGSPIPVRLIHN
jgi:Flp pilus assembly protein TadG